jgi:3-oxoacyl-[acyl-carrier-protein] synthase II
MTMGVSVGCMSSNMTKLTEYLEEASTSGYEKINRLTMMHILANIPAATINVKYGLKGPSRFISTACATGLSAIGEAYKWIRDG